MPDYCDRNDIDDLYGIENVIKWGDLDNDTAEISGTLTTRTDADTGIATVDSGHGVTINDTVDVFWNAGRIYGMTVTAQDSTTISIDGGSGDDLPVATTEIGIRLSDKMTTRIAKAIANAMEDIDSKMLGGVYTVPLVTAGGGVPQRIEHICAGLAGVWLYESRGTQDYDAEKRTAKHSLSFNKDEAYRELDEMRAGTRRINAVMVGESYPFASDHYTQIAADTDLTDEVRQGE